MNFDLSWNDAGAGAPPPRPAAPGPGNRETVRIVVCLHCRSRKVRCSHTTAAAGYWECGDCLGKWKEAPEVGHGRAHIA